MLDTSVLINLHACTYGERVLTGVPNSIVVPRIVVGELEHETSRKNGEHGFLRGLVAHGKVAIADMTEEELDLFTDLTSEAPTLDDGESATIAIATVRNLRPMIDERKGRSRSAALMDGEQPGWSLDLLRHSRVLQILGEDHATNALYLALRNGRMRVPSSFTEQAVNLIGVQRALECSCLPNYKSLAR